MATVCTAAAAVLGVAASGVHAVTGFEPVLTSVEVEPGAVGEVVAVCPVGKTATGGGFVTEEEDDSWEVLTSGGGFVSTNQTGWGVAARNTGTEPQTLHAEAICVDSGS